MKSFRDLFRRKGDAQQPAAETPEPQPLRIEGTTQAPLTPEPDDAELAAQALLEVMAQEVSSFKFFGERSGRAERQVSGKKRKKHGDNLKPETVADGDLKPETKDAAYYRRMAERMRQARDQATLRTMRFLAWCEQELKKPGLPLEGKGSLQQMEVELYKRIDTVERVGGELKRRWQHCLANVIVRQMPATGDSETE